MKREYIAPEVNVVKLRAERMLAGSDPSQISGGGSGSDIDDGFVDARGNNGGGDLWDE